MNNFFYFRVSTKTRNETEKQKQQEFNRQLGIFERAGFTGLVEGQNAFFDRESGGVKATDRPEFERMTRFLKKGDYIYFTETSRFARNYVDGIQTIDYLTFDLGVNLHFVSLGLTLTAGEKPNPAVWYTISQMLLADEYARRNIGWNTSQALQAKKAEGKILGRPKKFGKEHKDWIRKNQFKYTEKQLKEEFEKEFGITIGRDKLHAIKIGKVK